MLIQTQLESNNINFSWDKNTLIRKKTKYQLMIYTCNSYFSWPIFAPYLNVFIVQIGGKTCAIWLRFDRKIKSSLGGIASIRKLFASAFPLFRKSKYSISATFGPAPKRYREMVTPLIIGNIFIWFVLSTHLICLLCIGICALFHQSPTPTSRNAF